MGAAICAFEKSLQARLIKLKAIGLVLFRARICAELSLTYMYIGDGPVSEETKTEIGENVVNIMKSESTHLVLAANKNRSSAETVYHKNHLVELLRP
ncbi:hypothetical protein Tco_1129265 [Tanacetum coccineum]